MKWNSYAMFTVVSLLMFACAASRQTFTYIVPTGYTEEQKEIFLKRAAAGATLFKDNCSGCHGIFTQGKDGVPNFTKTQVDNYTAKFLRGDRKNHAVAIQMSSEQFFTIMAFLNARKVDSVIHK